MGNVSAEYFIGNGAYLEGIAQASIPAVIDADLRGNVIATGNVVAGYFLGNGALLEGIAQASIPAVIDADLRGNVIAMGNVSAEYFTGNGAYLEGIAQASIPAVIDADLRGNVIATGNVNAQYFTGNGAYLEGIEQASIPSDIEFNNVTIKQSILIGTNSKRILNVQKGILKSDGNPGANYEMLTYKFPQYAFFSNNIVVFTSVAGGVSTYVDQHFVVARNYGYNETYNCVYIQARDLLGSLSEPYEIHVLAIEYVQPIP
jgi:dUTPase